MSQKPRRRTARASMRSVLTVVVVLIVAAVVILDRTGAPTGSVPAPTASPILTAAVVSTATLAPSLASTSVPAPGATAAGPTPSAHSDWYDVYFPTLKNPDDPKSHKWGIDERLVALIDTARKTLDVADYDFDLANVADAMARAKSRCLLY